MRDRIYILWTYACSGIRPRHLHKRRAWSAGTLSVLSYQQYHSPVQAPSRRPWRGKVRAGWEVDLLWPTPLSWEARLCAGDGRRKPRFQEVRLSSGGWVCLTWLMLNHSLAYLYRMASRERLFRSGGRIGVGPCKYIVYTKCSIEVKVRSNKVIVWKYYMSFMRYMIMSIKTSIWQALWSL